MTSQSNERTGTGTDAGGPEARGARLPMARPMGPPEPRSRPGSTERRPLIERLGMAAIAVVLGFLFAGVAVAAYLGGELFLAAMAAIGSLMTLWVGGLTLVRG